jgi:para-nitrobenzyl esterase
MIAEGSQGFFRRAIVQSAPFGLFSGRKKMARAMAEVAAEIPASASVEEITNAQAGVVLAAQRFGLKSSMPFGVGVHPNSL